MQVLFIINPLLLQLVDVVEIYALFRNFCETEKHALQTFLLLECIMNSAGSNCCPLELVGKRTEHAQSTSLKALDKSGQFVPLH